jgi:hypothetical protein
MNVFHEGWYLAAAGELILDNRLARPTLEKA